MTNRDKLSKMTNEEIAKLHAETMKCSCSCAGCPAKDFCFKIGDGECKKNFKEWLESEA